MTGDRDFLARLPDMEVRGTGVVRHPPDAAARVRAELGRTADPVRRAELEAVLVALLREEA